jgi:hypothetical protein
MDERLKRLRLDGGQMLSVRVSAEGPGRVKTFFLPQKLHATGRDPRRRIDRANGIALVDPIIKAFRQKRRLLAILTKPVIIPP